MGRAGVAGAWNVEAATEAATGAAEDEAGGADVTAKAPRLAALALALSATLDVAPQSGACAGVAVGLLGAPPSGGGAYGTVVEKPECGAGIALLEGA